MSIKQLSMYLLLREIYMQLSLFDKKTEVSLVYSQAALIFYDSVCEMILWIWHSDWHVFL